MTAPKYRHMNYSDVDAHVDARIDAGSPVLRAIIRRAWHQTKHGMSCTLGLGDLTVLVLRRANGVYYRRLERPGMTQEWRSLRTTKRREAQERAGAFLVALARAVLIGPTPDTTSRSPGVTTLQELSDLYFRDCARVVENRPSWVSEQRRHIETLLTVLGGDSRADRLTANDLDRYATARSFGRIPRSEVRAGAVVPWTELRRPVKARTIQAEIKTLLSVLNFATTQWRADGARYLEASPVTGYKTRPELNPRRPQPDDEWCRTLRNYLANAARDADAAAAACRAAVNTAPGPACDSAHDETINACEQQRALAHRDRLVYEIACETGRRIGSIAALRWEDVNLARGTILWRKEHDKRGKEMCVPMSSRLHALLVEDSELLMPQSPWLFPFVTDPTRHMKRDQLSERHRKAIRLAGLEPIPGTVWHGYRRAWATDHQGEPREAVMRNGGWTDERTFRQYVGANEAIERDTVNKPIRGL